MKQLNQYIIEKFKLNSNNIKNQYNYHPKDKPDLVKIIMNKLAKDRNANLNDIDVSKITNMRYLFKELDPHNIDISEWDVSNVTDMGYMFFGCNKFNADISNWNVSNVTDMTRMFYYCKKFNCDISNWDVSHVTSISGMFTHCQKFNCDISNWDLSLCEHSGIDLFLNCKSLQYKDKITSEWENKYFKVF